MPTPFPGMDPYLESEGEWLDFHTRFLTHWSEAIANAIPEDYEVRIEERLRVIGPDEEDSRSAGGRGAQRKSDDISPASFACGSGHARTRGGPAPSAPERRTSRPIHQNRQAA
jgi:hypothetical protein